MEPVYLTITFYLLIVVVIAPLIIGACTATYGTPQHAHKDNPNDLTYCSYCGCRHRIAWMTWDNAGHYHCIICCDDHQETPL